MGKVVTIKKYGYFRFIDTEGGLNIGTEEVVGSLFKPKETGYCD
ncbi:MAG: hypothetical protein WCY53_02785 [Sphaerochaetaceae bacterium]|jgi:hypothetical protein